MDELLDNPQAIRILRILHGKGAINMREFIFYARMAERTARRLRDRMEAEWGLITVTEAKVRTTTDLEIRLTKEGEELARIFLSADAVFDLAKRRVGARSAR